MNVGPNSNVTLNIGECAPTINLHPTNENQSSERWKRPKLAVAMQVLPVPTFPFRSETTKNLDTWQAKRPFKQPDTAPGFINIINPQAAYN